MSLPTKLVLVVRAGLPPSLAVNAAAVVGLSLGSRLPHLLAEDGKDASGGLHAGLNPHPVPVLTASTEELVALHAKASAEDGLVTVGFTEVARRARDYQDYLADLAVTPGEEIEYIALGLFGPRTRVTALTKRFPLHV
ncbi:DUF2000 domain-containing protein [Sphaerisporangium fuscum]|uniref:DUF2000 domain-containing protein n=1 Tax=Sphaerisporangium fuscum TaxID=2835868 RepID=UPI001BDDA0A1|nr:DUF2000 domain-containing protein [Sphaerisporangium fuscum]